MKLVEDWKESYKWLSIHIAAVIGALNALQATVPYVQGILTQGQLGALNAVLAVALIWGRMIQQGQP